MKEKDLVACGMLGEIVRHLIAGPMSIHKKIRIVGNTFNRAQDGSLGSFLMFRIY